MGEATDTLEFLYSLVKDLFDTMRLVGKYIGLEDLEDQLMRVRRSYIEQSENH